MYEIFTTHLDFLLKLCNLLFHDHLAITHNCHEIKMNFTLTVSAKIQTNLNYLCSSKDV